MSDYTALVISSLELLILALVEEGLQTPYDLRRAGISVGAAHPALQRLVQRKLLTRGETGARRKAEYRLTSAGKKALGSWGELLAAYLDEPPSDLESVFRVAALAHVNGNQKDAVALLKHAAKLWSKPTEPRSSAEEPAQPGPDLAALYRWMLTIGEAGRAEGEGRALRRIVDRLRQGKPRARKQGKPRPAVKNIDEL